MTLVIKKRPEETPAVTSPADPLSMNGEGEPETQGASVRSPGGVGVTGSAGYVDPAKIARARSFRRAPTPASSEAWQILRGRRLLGLKFRREQVIAGFIADFYCPALRLVIELDGGVHDEPDQAEYDAVRTQCFAALGLRVVRVRNEDVSADTFLQLLTAFLPLSIHGEGAGGEVP